MRHSAYIRENVIIGNDVVIGNSTEIKNSILFNKVQVHIIIMLVIQY
ncbi:hypothetical protein [Clostridium sp. C2-6-12]